MGRSRDLDAGCPPRRLPPVRGRLTANAPIGALTWFRVGGPAEMLFRPADATTSPLFSRRCRRTCR